MEKCTELYQDLPKCGMNVRAVARPFVMTAAGIAYQEKPISLIKRESVRSVVLQQSYFRENNRFSNPVFHIRTFISVETI